MSAHDNTDFPSNVKKLTVFRWVYERLAVVTSVAEIAQMTYIQVYVRLARKRILRISEAVLLVEVWLYCCFRTVIA